jgi:hypothetical protein
VPCDQGGLEACWYYPIYGLSPGEPLDPDDALALRLDAQAARLGWDVVLALKDLRLSRWRADMLLLRLDYLARYRQQQQSAQQEAWQHSG